MVPQIIILNSSSPAQVRHVIEKIAMIATIAQWMTKYYIAAQA